MSSTHGELCVAIINNNLSQIKKIIAQKIDLNAKIPWDSITMKPASSRKKSVKNKEENNVYEALPLNLAVIFSSVEVVQELLQYGANPIMKDGRSRCVSSLNFRSAIVCAIYGDLDTLVISPENFLQITTCNERHVHMINILFKGSETYSYSDILQEANSPQEGPFLRGITPLCLAAYLGKVDMVGKLIDMGLSVNSTDKNGATALMYAVRDGHVAVVQELLSKNASIDLQDNNGWRASQYGKKFPDIIRMLEENSLQKMGANKIFPPEVMAKLQANYPSFYSDLSAFLAPYGDLENSKKPDLEAQCVEVQTELAAQEIVTFDSLAKCISSGNVKDLKMLLDSQSNAANLKDDESGLPIILYVLRYRPLNLEISEMMIKLLVSAGANLKVVDLLTGMNALHFLLHVSFSIDNSKDPFLLSDVERCDPLSSLISQMARFLAENGCITDLPDSLGNRPLHYACQIGDSKTVRCLVLDYNVDLFKPNSNGKIPLDYSTSAEINDFLTSEMSQKKLKEESTGFNPSEETIKNLQIEPLQRIQQFLIHAFEDATAVLSKELTKEQTYETMMTNMASEESSISNSAANYDLELKLNHLQDEMQKSQDESSKTIQDRDRIIFNLEGHVENLQKNLHSLEGQLEESNVSLVAKIEQISDMESQYDIVKKSLVKATETSVILSSQLKDMERTRSQQISSLQLRIEELENLARRKDEVIRQMGETKRVINSPKIDNNQTESSKINQLDLHSDILKANLEAVVEDLRVLRSVDDDKNAVEILRLEKERESIEQQMTQVMNERQSVMESPEATPNRSSRGFMHLEDLLGQLQVNSVEVSPPYTPDGSPIRESEDGKFSHRMSYRMSTVINQEECDLDPNLVNRLLDAAKRKIQRLKRRCETFEDETIELRNQLEEKEIHIRDTYGLLQTANSRTAEVESKLSRRGADQDKFNLKVREIEKERMIDLNRLRKAIEEFIGPTNNDNDIEMLQGILGMIHSLFLELDPVLLGSLPSHLVNPTSDDMIQLAEFSEDFTVDSHRYNSHLLKVLNDVASRIKEYLNHLGIALGSMKKENKKFVKEIMKLKKEAVVKSLVSNVRDTIDPKRLGRLDFSENEIRKHLQRRVDPPALGSPATTYPSTPLRPARMNRQSALSHKSPSVSETSVAYSVSAMTSEASDIMESLKRLKLEISRLQAVEDPSVEAKARVTELKQEYRNSVKRLMEVLKTETNNDATSSTSQELKDRLKQMSTNLTEIRESLTA